MAIFDMWMGMILPILSLHVAGSLPSCFYSRGYMVLEEDVGWRIPRWRFLVHGHLWWVHGVIVAVSESPCCQKPFIQFLLNMIYGLGKDVGWRIPICLFSGWPSLMCEWGAFSYSESLSLAGSLQSSFFLKRICGLEEMFKEQKDSC